MARRTASRQTKRRTAPRKPAQTRAVTVRIPRELLDRLRQSASGNGTSVNALIVESLMRQQRRRMLEEGISALKATGVWEELDSETELWMGLQEWPEP